MHVACTSQSCKSTHSPRDALTTFSSWLPSSSSLPSRSNSFSLISWKQSRKGFVRLGDWYKGKETSLHSAQLGHHRGSGCLGGGWTNRGRHSAWQPARGASARSLGRNGIWVQVLEFGRGHRRALSRSVNCFCLWMENVGTCTCWHGSPSRLCSQRPASQPFAEARPGEQDY